MVSIFVYIFALLSCLVMISLFALCVLKYTDKKREIGRIVPLVHSVAAIILFSLSIISFPEVKFPISLMLPLLIMFPLFVLSIIIGGNIATSKIINNRHFIWTMIITLAHCICVILSTLFMISFIEHM